MKKFSQTTLIALLISSSVFSQMKNEPVKDPSGGTTVYQAKNSQIILLSPADGKQFASSEVLKPILFRWTAMMPKTKETVTYRLKVWQLMQGQNGAEAMRSNQPIITKDVVNFTQATISNLYTGPCKPPYLCDYVWIAEASSEQAKEALKSDYGTFRIMYNETKEPSAKSAPGPEWETYREPVFCERKGVLFTVGKKIGIDQFRLSCTFTDIEYYENPAVVAMISHWPSFISSEQVIIPAGDTRKFCNKDGIIIDGMLGVYKVKEHNPKVGGLTDIPYISPFTTLSFDYLTTLWNNNHDGGSDGVSIGCPDCEVEYIEGGNEGPEAGEIPEIEFEGYEEPDTSGSVIAHINEVVHNGTNLYFKIRNEKQIAELKNIGLVLSPSRFSDLVKCPCAKNAWAKNKEAAVKICIYVKRLIAEAKQVRFKVKSLVKE